jgi:hypothetical protein
MSGGARPAIMLTGYWAPTNSMLRPFSANPAQNPGGWIGADWEGRGYDVYAYFPEFPPANKGQGDLEVDYQDTSADFWPLAAGITPIAVMTFSRGLTDDSWEVEQNNRNNLVWFDDYCAPLQPTPSPPDGSLPAGAVRLSTLPMQAIVDAVEDANLPLNPYICTSGNGGGFLSEFIAYHGAWYQALHASPQDVAWCIAGGHVHVGGLSSVPRARRATKASLRALIHYLDTVLDQDTLPVTTVCATSNHSAAGFGAVLTTTGSMSIARNDLRLIVTDAIPGDFGLVFYGPGTTAPTPFGDGVLCVATPHSRVLPATSTDADGYQRLDLDLALRPFSAGVGQVHPGDTFTFQYWYRDAAAGGAGYNTSSAIEITFAP